MKSLKNGNLYDVAGNVWEWKLVPSIFSDSLGRIGAGAFDYYGTFAFTIEGGLNGGIVSAYDGGFRVCMY